MRQGVISAISTPPGKGGVAIIRMCGDGAVRIAERVFFPISGRSLSDYPARMQVYGRIMDDGRVVDDGMATYFNKNASYTGEETVELSIHGGVLVTRTVLELLFKMGTIPARAGEFTRLAFLNGRLSLTEVEAIGDLLEAKSTEQLKLFSEDSRSRLKNKISEIRSSLTRLLGSMYARIDYPEEDLGEFSDEEVLRELLSIRASISALISTYRTGRAINEGIRTVLVGKPNVGKSTLYNLLLGEDAAIVTDIPGTTRDTLSATIPLGRVLLHLTDTAGVHAEGVADTVEKIGIERTLGKLGTAELVLALFDAKDKLSDEDISIIKLVKSSPATVVAVLTKAECEHSAIKEELSRHFDRIISISAACDPEGALELITKTVERLFTDEKINTSSDAIIASARQHGALSAALRFIDTAIEAFRLGIPADAASSDIELCLGAIGEVDGRAVSDEVVSDIFSRFCVGK